MEIKFRGKRIDTGEWIYGSYLEFAGYSEIMIHDGISYPRYEVVKESVGQFIGIRAINDVDFYKKDFVLGTELYTGDILMGSWNTKLVIYYDKTSVMYRVRLDNGHNREISYFCRFNGSDYEKGIQAVIIGNTTDNPELLN